jgi:hypothetical protein
MKIENRNDIEKAAEKLLASDPDLRAEQEVEVTIGKCPFSTTTSQAKREASEPLPFHFVPLRMGGGGGTHKPSEGSRALIEQEVSLGDLMSMTEKFYDKAFQDATLDKFIRSHNDPHGSRFAKFVHQKLYGSTLWDEDRASRDLTPVRVAGGRTAVVHDRSSAHVAAWYSSKRPSNEVGRHFNLEESRVWMRLHFWGMREAGLVDKSPSFADYYVRFIGHFIAVYERSATQFARESFRWSAKPSNIERYINDGRQMKDVLGVKYSKALNDLPEEEAHDDEWPHNGSPQ